MESTSPFLSSEPLRPDEKPHILCIEDSMGPEMARMGILPTKKAGFDLSHNHLFSLNHPFVAQHVGKERLTWLEERSGIGIVPLKAGFLEEIDVVFLREHPVIFSLPHPEPIIVSKQKAKHIFLESQRALQQSSLHLPGFCPDILDLYEGEFPCVLQEFIADGYEEVNPRLSGDATEPTLNFLTRDPQKEALNTLFQQCSPEEKQRLMAYTTAKVIAARTLMTLTTIHRHKGFQTAWTPCASTMDAGDFLIRFNEKSQMEIRPITYRGGTKRVFSLDEAIDDMSQRDTINAFILINGKRATGKTLPLIPHFPARNEWITSIVGWTTRTLYTHAQREQRSTFHKNIAQFVQNTSRVLDWEQDVEEAQSPFSPDALDAVASYFGSSWLRE